MKAVLISPCTGHLSNDSQQLLMSAVAVWVTRIRLSRCERSENWSDNADNADIAAATVLVLTTTGN